MSDTPRRRSSFRVYSPVVDEAIIQISDVHGSIAGRPMSEAETELAREVFSDSVDYARVRLLFGIAAGTTAGNNIRLPTDFSISSADNKELLVHEMTHVWQYQHFGPGYITTSLLQQAHAGLFEGMRNWAYEYTLGETDRYNDYNPEQQAFIVENYYAMKVDREILGMNSTQISGTERTYQSIHFGANGFKRRIDHTSRRTEIHEEWENHVRIVSQMRTIPPLNIVQLMSLRRETLIMDRSILDPRIPFTGRDRELLQIAPLIRIEFNGL